MKQRQIATTFWEDGYTLELTDQEKVFFIYLFTNSKVNMIGIYELPDRLIYPTLGCTLQDLKRMKEKFEQDKKFAFFDGWIFINNYADYNSYSPVVNVVNAYVKDFNSIPQKILIHFLHTLKLPFSPTVRRKDNTDIVKVMDMDKDRDKEATPYPRIKAISLLRSEVEPDIDLDEVDKYIGK